MNIPQEWYDTYKSDMDINDDETHLEVYIDNKKIEELKVISNTDPVIDFDKFIEKVQKFFQYIFSPRYFTPNNKEIDDLDKDFPILNMV
ncbi:hypothetical protein ma726 [Moumouvirus australiensis]|uniref:Uncharacterized protein n=1 Tax=Moumouvirus australiensis TaxID=2109587 RepID=A0A2P1EML0_9VIRU|nr:hypothetical protein QKC55_gp178 [Moumouvirus australiensis]AVL95113.1 hypothetical protein ma726 [Moumouvirus australiensis]